MWKQITKQVAILIAYFLDQLSWCPYNLDYMYLVVKAYRVAPVVDDECGGGGGVATPKVLDSFQFPNVDNNILW